jgi:phytoene dehydrogenase-like protein
LIKLNAGVAAATQLLPRSRGSMPAHFDAIVIGSGLGGLTAGAKLSLAGRKVLVLERNHSPGGAASTYKAGDLVVEASLHETADPRNPLDPKHHVLAELGVLNAVEWVPIGSFYEVRGGPVGEPFLLPDNFAAARDALSARFPKAKPGMARVLGDMERIATGVGALSRGRDAFRDWRSTRQALSALLPIVRGWRRSVSDVFTRAFGDNEAVKCALAANISYYHDDPDTLWWLFFALVQGGYLNSGACYIRGGSQRLSLALAGTIKHAGGEVVLRRHVTEIRLDRDGKPSAVVHTDRNGADRSEAEAPIVIANAAPTVVADMLPDAARQALRTAYEAMPPSTSLFALTLGLSEPPANFGMQSYSTFLLPGWLNRLADFRRGGDLLAGPPQGEVPGLAVVNYSKIDSGLGGPPYPISIVGLDRVANWEGLDAAADAEKRRRWQDAIVAALDRAFPGTAARVTASVFNTASSLRNYLGTPHGSVYGFAPRPPSGPIWHGIERSPRTPLPQLYLASSYAGSGGFPGAILAGNRAADCILADT